MLGSHSSLSATMMVTEADWGERGHVWARLKMHESRRQEKVDLPF